MREFSLLEKKLNLNFKNKKLLTQAFVHRSFLNENPDFKIGNNERLEFLGDAVLELVVTEYLYQKYPKKSEGELTNWRAALVNADSLAKIAERIGLNNFLLLSKGESKEMNKARRYILANTIEAFIGALYLDLGYKASQEFIKKQVIKELPQIIKSGSYKDSKSHFQEKAQEKTTVTPTYKILEEWGPDHAKHFKVGVFLKEGLIAEGEGSSKQEAEVKAAEKALKIKDWL
ncbi:MAG: ribonuclease III [Candidatus Nealsonbacteria bacterium]|nr:ribonuclease III [Candidatus Nealsonbacteria bacterium]